MPLETRITLYNSLVRPLFDYGDTTFREIFLECLKKILHEWSRKTQLEKLAYIILIILSNLFKSCPDSIIVVALAFFNHSKGRFDGFLDLNSGHFTHRKCFIM